MVSFFALLLSSVISALSSFASSPFTLYSSVYVDRSSLMPRPHPQQAVKNKEESAWAPSNDEDMYAVMSGQAAWAEDTMYPS